MASGDPSFCALPDREASSVLLPASDSWIAGTDALLQPWDDLQVYAFPLIVVVRKVLVNWGPRGAAIELSSLRSGLRGNDSRTFWNCYQTFPSSHRSATTDPFPPLSSDLPVPQLTSWLLSRDSPVSPASLRQVINNFPSFEGSSDLWIFRLDGIPMRCDMPKSMFDHPHSLFLSLLNSWPFLLKRKGPALSTIIWYGSSGCSPLLWFHQL